MGNGASSIHKAMHFRVGWIFACCLGSVADFGLSQYIIFRIMSSIPHHTTIDLATYTSTCHLQGWCQFQIESELID